MTIVEKGYEMIFDEFEFLVAPKQTYRIVRIHWLDVGYKQVLVIDL